MQTNFVECPFDAFLKVKHEKISETNLKVTMPIEPLYLNSIGVVHGGVICSLADIAMGNIFGADANNNQKMVTVDMNTTFLKQAKGKFLIADAVLIKKGKTLNHIDCLIYNDQNELVAKATAIFMNLKELSTRRGNR
ncbi:PaaI family thioesterase [Bacillus benzoevorans]|uniref:Acyl-CoA thioesterase n=1 Tax=Bacillus benzoevorans TaxID=1456 RepID=A0A7X0HV45_9BACI|nr:PaaI family thioesterase [Bacillus benzoevorans]MBB6446225.1 acyl-CoA thioesterase [Bacillus benzoevorans]